MSYLGIIVTSVFASNAFLSYGLGSIAGRGSKPEARRAFASVLTLVFVNALASSLLWCLHSLLAPLSLGSIDVLFFAMLAVPLLKFAAKASATRAGSLFSGVGLAADQLIVGSLVFGIALIVARGGFTFPEALAGSAASGLGYWLVSALLETIRQRLELSDLPRPMRGAPAMLVSAGLIALALMGVDAAFVRNLAG